MALTQVDRNAALIVIDMQKGILGMPVAHPVGEIVGRAAEMARAFRERGLPVVLVNVTGAAPGRTNTPRPNFAPAPDWAELVPELEPQTGDYTVSKQRWGGFIGTEMERILREREVTQVFLAGVATSIGVESTARSLYDAGYNVVLVVDVMTDRDAAAHDYRVDKVFPRLGEVETAENVLKMLRG
jgi:nicotinamidase-related amidase